LRNELVHSQLKKMNQKQKGVRVFSWNKNRELLPSPILSV
jgi:hypothetical protein